MPETRSLVIATLSALVTAMASPVVLAHHGPVFQSALYLADNLIELQGEIVAVFWRYPHTRARLRVVDDEGEEQLWEIEMEPTPREWEQLGVNEEDLFGLVRAAGYISRRDSNVLGASNILLPNGRELALGRSDLIWSDDRISVEEPAVDPDRAAQERRTATGIFRTWGPRLGRRPQADDYHHLLTERGRELAALYYAPTDNPELECRTGVGASMPTPSPLEIIDEGGRITVHQAEYNVRRTIWLDPDASGVEATPGPLGYSVGRWEDDVLIVHTTHIDFPYLDPYGTPQSDQIEYLERLQVSESEGEVVLNHSLTATDPVMYAEPIVLEWLRRWSPGSVIDEFDCAVDWESESE